MSSPVTLPISDIVNVVVQISPQAPAQPTFNQGLIVGNSTVIPSYGASSRVRQYSSLAQMTSDGFTTNSPEYLAASSLMAQTPPPQFFWVGRQDLTAISTVIPHAGNAGINYAVGDLVTIVQGGGSHGVAHVVSIGGGGAVTALDFGTPGATQGTGYADATALTTTGGAGTGLEVDITSIGESCLQALQACRAASYQWYACMVIGAALADHEAIASWAESITPVVAYMGQTSDAAVLANSAGNVLSVLKAAGYRRTMMIYSTTQSGAAPNNIYAAAALIGRAMGLNSGLAGSYYTMKFKTLVGIIAEPLTETQKNSIENNNGNLYLSYGNAYTFVEQGVMMNGTFFDELVGLDMLASDMQYNVMNLLTENPSIPQTDPGETQLIHAVNQACETALAIGFIAGGIWEGVRILNLFPGNPVPKGYITQAPPYSTQSTSDRQARKAMPIYVAIIEAGSTHFLTIGVYVQR